MSDDNKETSILPKLFNPGEAKAIEETARAWGITVDAATKLGGFFSRALGTIPQDALGLIIGDWLHHRRIRVLAGRAQGTEEILRKRGILGKTEPISTNIVIPLLQAAQDENRPELQELWERLIANAMDPKRSKDVRRNIIETVKQFEPLDANFLEVAVNSPWGKNKEAVKLDKLQIDATEDKLYVSIENLIKLDCIKEGAGSFGAVKRIESIHVSPLGREVIRACRP